MGILLHLFRGRRKETPCRPVDQPKHVNARRHLPGSIYALPKDITEERRIDFQHYVFHQLLKGHYVAPIDNPRSILDVGTGTGRWPIDMAKLFPQAQVVGMDKETPYESAIEHPRNYQFVEGNVLEGFPFADNTFSFSHQRLLVGAIPTARWPFVLRELVRVTQPGGFIELVEGGNNYLKAGPAMSQIVQWGMVASQQVGIDPSLMTNLDTMMSSAGMQNVNLTLLQVPVGRWGGRVGELMSKDMHPALAGLRDFYCSKLNISSEQFQAVIDALPDEWEKKHTEYEFYIAHGQKSY